MLLPTPSAIEVIESEPCVFLCVCVSALSQPNRLTYDLNFWYGSLTYSVSQSITKKGLLGKRTVQFGKRVRYVNTQAFLFPV